MSPEIVAALKPDLNQLKGDGIKWSGKMGGGKQSIITWQGIERTLQEWAYTLSVSNSCIRYRLRNMPLNKAMDLTKKPGQSRAYIKEEKQPVRGLDYSQVPPVGALL